MLRLILAAFLCLASNAFAEVRIDLNSPNVRPKPIAVVNLSGSQESENQYGRDIAKVVAADLERSGLFKPIDSRAFIQSAESLLLQPRFADWRAINAELLVNGKVETTPDGKLRVEFRLWDVYAEVQQEGKAYNTVAQNWRRIAHMISDAIYSRITGESGYFDTRVVYIAESGPRNKRVKRLAIMDQDGENHKFLTDGADMVLTPRFSPSLMEITYMSYYRNTPRVYIFNLENGRREVVGDFPGMTFAPRFSPDGNKVIMSMATDANSQIYQMDLRTRRIVQLTDHASINTSPSFSPDAREVTFNSDRSGGQQLYVMNADGSNQRRISFGDGRYGTPVWSPRGDLIAFTKMKGGEFYIGVMRPDGSGERLLTQGFLVEGPTWAPNGRVLMFFRQTQYDDRGGSGKVKLYSIDLTGYNERELVTPVDGSDPAWSPLIP